MLKHSLARLLCLITVPCMLYVYIFYVHLSLLTKAGPHDNVMTSAFQASLEVGSSVFTFLYNTFKQCLHVSKHIVCMTKPHTNKYKHTATYTHVHMYPCTHSHMYTLTHVHTHTCTHMYSHKTQSVRT